MMQISVSEGLLYGGLGAMGAAIILGIICAVVFHCTGRKLKRKLTEEYGSLKP